MGTTYLTDGDDLTSVANAIRAKSGGSSQLAFPAGFVSEIQAIPSGGLGNFELLDTVTVSSPVSQVSLTIPSGYTQIAISYSVNMSASTKANFYHTSVASSRETNASGTGTSKAGAFVLHGLDACTVDGFSITARTVAQSSTDQLFAPVAYAFPPTTVVCACNASGATINSGTFKIYGR